MVGVDTSCDVGVQILILQARCVTVDLFMVRLRCDDFGNGLSVGRDDAGEIHHFRKS